MMKWWNLNGRSDVFAVANTARPGPEAVASDGKQQTEGKSTIGIFDTKFGTFPNEKTYENYEKFPSNALEYWLAYDHQGRLFKIHTTDNTLAPDVLIGLVKKMTVAK